MGRERPRTGADRRDYPRYPVTAMRVDYSTGEHFLFAPLENISAMGIFIRTSRVFPVGTRMHLAFALEGGTEKLALEGEVAWINAIRDDANDAAAGMGVRFVDLDEERREAVLELIHALAYVH